MKNLKNIDDWGLLRKKFTMWQKAIDIEIKMKWIKKEKIFVRKNVDIC